MQSQIQPKGQTPAKYMLYGVITLIFTAYGYADTVYRCGDAYSPLVQCAHGAAAELKPHELHQNAVGTSQASSHDLQGAQALEKQRLQAERQAALSAPVRMSTPLAPAAPASHPAPMPHHGKYAHRTPSPYFMAIDPNSRPQKKSTAKAVPAQTP